MALIVFQSTAGLFLFLFRAGPSPHYTPPPPLSSLSLSLIPWAHTSHSCFLALQAAPSVLEKYCANSGHILPLNETPRLTDCLSSSLGRGKNVIFFFNRGFFLSPLLEVVLSEAKLEHDLFLNVFTTQHNTTQPITALTALTAQHGELFAIRVKYFAVSEIVLFSSPLYSFSLISLTPQTSSCV